MKKFKDYQINQIALPMNLVTLIPDNHLVKIINEVVDKINLDSIIDKYKGGGTTAYNPRMLIKVLVYAYSLGIFSGREIEEQLRANVYFMWLAGSNKPNFRTINRFRSERLKDEIDGVFKKILTILIEVGLVKLENIFIDGTKVEANVNKYSFVWKKSTENYKGKLDKDIDTLLKNINLITEEEMINNTDLEEKASSDILKEVLNKLDDSIKKKDEVKDKKEIKELKKAKKKIEKDYLPRSTKYESYLKTLGDRNSFSKTDTDATFMRMKEDHMKNGQLKAGYNVQVSTENQIILGYSIYQKPNDTTCLIPHLEKIKENLDGIIPENTVADAGYGSEENYEYLFKNNLVSYVKYNTWYKEHKNQKIGKYFNLKDLIYDRANDEYICRNGERLIYQETEEKATGTGYIQKIKKYQCSNCKGCELSDLCKKNLTSNRSISINESLEEYKRITRQNLWSEEGTALCKRRGVDVEPIFGMIKGNLGLRRFHLRGLSKVNVEWGLLSIGHNLKKLRNFLRESIKKGTILQLSQFILSFLFRGFTRKETLVHTF